MMKSAGFVRTLAIVLPTTAILLALPAQAGAPLSQEARPSRIGSGVMTSPGLGALDNATTSGASSGRIQLARKLPSVVRGAAIGSSIARRSNKADATPSAGDEPAASIGSAGQPENSQAASSAASADPAASRPVRTVPDRNHQNAPAPAKEAADSSCIAGCYTPTSTQSAGPIARRAAASEPAVQPAIAQPAFAPSGLQCIAGCDGIIGPQLPRATPGAATAVSSRQSGPNRIVVMRGSSRTKTYGVSQ